MTERLYTGELFGDKGYVWALYETEHYARQYTSLVIRLAEALMIQKDTATASKLLHKLKERNPLDETVMRLLMEACAVSGDRKELTALYGDYVKLIHRELGIGPSEELRVWYARLEEKLETRKT